MLNRSAETSAANRQARALLEGGGDPVEHIAQAAGFGSSESMRRAFRQTLGVAPIEYREAADDIETRLHPRHTD
ncbi:helix-turn-helix domain-containing protein [Streptomyces sp. NPDC055400]